MACGFVSLSYNNVYVIIRCAFPSKCKHGMKMCEMSESCKNIACRYVNRHKILQV